MRLDKMPIEVQNEYRQQALNTIIEMTETTLLKKNILLKDQRLWIKILRDKKSTDYYKTDNMEKKNAIARVCDQYKQITEKATYDSNDDSYESDSSIDSTTSRSSTNSLKASKKLKAPEPPKLPKKKDPSDLTYDLVDMYDELDNYKTWYEDISGDVLDTAEPSFDEKRIHVMKNLLYTKTKERIYFVDRVDDKNVRIPANWAKFAIYYYLKTIDGVTQYKYDELDNDQYEGTFIKNSDVRSRLKGLQLYKINQYTLNGDDLAEINNHLHFEKVKFEALFPN